MKRNAGSPWYTRERIMKIKKLDKYSKASILLMIVAADLVALAFITNLGEFITASFVISGASCALTGILVLTFSTGESSDPKIVGILSAQRCINFCRMISDLGVTGNAFFLPPRITGEVRVMQFNPTLTYSGSHVSAKDSFTKTGPAGLVSIPCCEPLIQDLKKRNALVIRNTEEELIILIGEIIGEVFDFASRISVSWHDNTVIITFHGHRFIEGCKVINHESTDYCTMDPCPVCRLCGDITRRGNRQGSHFGPVLNKLLIPVM